MDHLERPSEEDWEDRRNWFEQINEQYAGNGSYLVSEQACALLMDVQSAFCVGAWITVIILAMSVIDAQLRETELPGFVGNSKDLIDQAGANPKLQQMRKRRNALVHLGAESPAITVDQQWANRASLELEARKAVELMFEAFYLSPWT